MAITPARRWVRMLAAIAALSAALSVTSSSAMAADDEDGGAGLGISVTVISPVGAGGAANAPTTRTPTRQSTTPASTVNTAAPAPQPASTDIEVAGGLFLSDITGTSRPTANPFEGASELWFTLRNSSADTLDLTADFSVATLYGARIDGELVQVTAIKPGESRVVGVTLAGGGQWPFVVGRVTIDPPDTIAGQATAPVARAGMIWVFPWMLLGIGLIAALVVVLLRVRPALFARVPIGTVPA